MKKIIKVVNPARRKRVKKNPLLIQSPFRRIKKTTSFKTHSNPKSKKSNLTINGKETPVMAVKKRTRRHHNPVVFANKHKRHHRRHRNPAGGGTAMLSSQGITSIFMDGLIVGGSMVGVNWLSNFVVNKFFPDMKSPWMKYAIMAGVSLLGGWGISKANARVGKDFATGGIGLTILTIANEQLTFLKQTSMAPVLKGDDDDGQLLGELSLRDLSQASALRDSLLGSAELNSALLGDGGLGSLEMEEDVFGDENIEGYDDGLEGASFNPGAFAPGYSY